MYFEPLFLTIYVQRISMSVCSVTDTAGFWVDNVHVKFDMASDSCRTRFAVWNFKLGNMQNKKWNIKLSSGATQKHSRACRINILWKNSELNQKCCHRDSLFLSNVEIDFRDCLREHVIFVNVEWLHASSHRKSIALWNPESSSSEAVHTVIRATCIKWVPW